jgi:hypothetical protein
MYIMLTVSRPAPASIKTPPRPQGQRRSASGSNTSNSKPVSSLESNKEITQDKLFKINKAYNSLKSKKDVLDEIMKELLIIQNRLENLTKRGKIENGKVPREGYSVNNEAHKEKITSLLEGIDEIANKNDLSNLRQILKGLKISMIGGTRKRKSSRRKFVSVL